MSTEPDPTDLDPEDLQAAADLQRQLAAADIDLSDVKAVVDEQRATASDDEGNELSVRDLMDWGLSRRQALKALGLVLAGATWGGALATIYSQPARAGTSSAGTIGTVANPVDVEAEDINMASSGALTDPAGNTISDFAGSNLSVSGGALQASGGGAIHEGFISGLLTEYVSSSQASIQTGWCIADDDSTVINVDSTLTADISTTGAGGRQAGLAEQASSWYEVFVIDDSSGTNSPAAYLVEESQTFSFPSGYDVKRSVGWVRNDGTSNLYNFHHEKPDTVIWQDQTKHEPLNTTTPATSYTAVDLGPHIPPTAEFAWLRTLGTGDGTAASHSLNIRPGDTSPGVLNEMLVCRGYASHSAQDAETAGVVMVSDSQNILYKANNESDALIRVVGYINPR